MDFTSLLATPATLTLLLAHIRPLLPLIRTTHALLKWQHIPSSLLLILAYISTCIYAHIIYKHTIPIILCAIWSREAWKKNQEKKNKIETEQEEQLEEEQGIKKLVNEIHACIVSTNSLFCKLSILYAAVDGSDFAYTRKITIYYILPAYLFWLTINSYIPKNYIVMVAGVFALSWHSPVVQLVVRKIDKRFAVQQKFTKNEMDNRTASQKSVPYEISNLFRKKRDDHIISDDESNEVASLKSETDLSIGAGFVLLADGRLRCETFENQRWWLGLGFTNHLFPEERAPYSSENGKENLPLHAFDIYPKAGQWEWEPNSSWQVDTTPDLKKDTEGWTYFDNWWNRPRNKQGFSRVVRRRKWFRHKVSVISKSRSPTPVLSASSIASGKML